MTASSPQRTVLGAIIFLVSLTIFRLWYCTHLDLVFDEAYYWEWSRHLDACYRDKGPAIAWTVAAGTWLAGDTVFGIRWLGVLLASGTAWQLFVLARRLFDEKIALITLIVAAFVPLLAVGSILMTIDSLSVFFWIWGMNLMWEAVKENKLSSWAWLGFAIGCGFLAKFTNVLQFGTVLLYLLWTPALWRRIVSEGTILMGVVFALCTTPIFWWNIVHDWPNKHALESRSGVDAGFHIHLGQLGKFLMEQAMVISPLLWLGMLIAVAGLWFGGAKAPLQLFDRPMPGWFARIWQVEDRIRFLICGFLPVYGCFTFFSLNVAGKANWTAPALMTGLILLVVFWRSLVAKSRWWWIPVGLALFLSVAETIILHETFWLNLPPKRDPLQRARGWEDLAQHTQHWKDQYKADYVIGNHYSQAALLAFYLPGKPVTYTPVNDKGIENQYALWPGYDVGPNTSAIYVTNDMAPNAYPEALARQFKHVTLLESFFTQQWGRPVRDFQIFLFTNREEGPK